MRKFFFTLFFILILVLCILFFYQFYQSKTNVHRDENLSLSSLPTPTLVGSSLKPKSNTRAARPVKNGVKDNTDHTYAYRSYHYSTKPASAAVSDSEPVTPSEPAPSSESALKYVLFSVTYETQMIAGETKSLQLRMSPKNELAKLEKALSESKIQQSQIKEIEKVKSKYRYVSAHLVAKNNCLKIEKKMPDEEKVYLPNVNESSADQIWQWDLTASDVPKIKMCHLSLFIRFCLNQNDCLPMQDPDKEFSINIEITTGQKIYKWFTGIGEVGGIVITLLTIAGIIGGWRICRRKPTRRS